MSDEIVLPCVHCGEDFKTTAKSGIRRCHQCANRMADSLSNHAGSQSSEAASAFETMKGRVAVLERENKTLSDDLKSANVRANGSEEAASKLQISIKKMSGDLQSANTKAGAAEEAASKLKIELAKMKVNK